MNPTHREGRLLARADIHFRDAEREKMTLMYGPAVRRKRLSEMARLVLR